MRSEEWDPHGGISALVRRDTRELAAPLCVYTKGRSPEDPEVAVACRPGRESSPDPSPAGILTPAPSPQSRENALVRCRSVGFVPAARADEYNDCDFGRVSCGGFAEFPTVWVCLIGSSGSCRCGHMTNELFDLLSQFCELTHSLWWCRELWDSESGWDEPGRKGAVRLTGTFSAGVFLR